MKKIIWLALLPVLVIAGMMAAVSCGASSTTTATTPITTLPTITATTTTASTTGTPMPVDNVEVLIENDAFTPPAVTIPPGTVITWKNNDPVTHTVVSDTGAFESQNLAKGDSYQFTFTTPGTYAYHCSVHPFMKGTITVQ